MSRSFETSSNESTREPVMFSLRQVLMKAPENQLGLVWDKF